MQICCDENSNLINRNDVCKIFHVRVPFSRRKTKLHFAVDTFVFCLHENDVVVSLYNLMQTKLSQFSLFLLAIAKSVRCRHRQIHKTLWRIA